MPEKRIEGVKVQDSPHKKWQYDYGMGDMKALYRRGDWHNWQEEIRWLENHGEADNELTPGETIAMVEDLRSLNQREQQALRPGARTASRPEALTWPSSAPLPARWRRARHADRP